MEVCFPIKNILREKKGPAAGFHCLSCGCRMITLAEASKMCGVPSNTLYNRMYRKGMTLKEAMEFKRYSRK